MPLDMSQTPLTCSVSFPTSVRLSHVTDLDHHHHLLLTLFCSHTDDVYSGVLIPYIMNIMKKYSNYQ